jgi:hypothetical protein
LNLPLEADRFIADLQAEMRAALQTLDAGLPSNPSVRIGRKHGSSWVTLTPFDAQPEPPNLTALKAEITATWPMTSLLDMVKETDLRLGFTDVLKSPTAYESLDRAILQPRLLLRLYGLEACFHQAIEIARKQQAKSLELRAMMSFSRLWQKQGKKAEAHKMLAEIYGWFTEGFDTKDLQEAKALLEELA